MICRALGPPFSFFAIRVHTRACAGARLPAKAQWRRLSIRRRPGRPAAGLAGSLAPSRAEKGRQRHQSPGRYWLAGWAGEAQRPAASAWRRSLAPKRLSLAQPPRRRRAPSTGKAPRPCGPRRCGPTQTILEPFRSVQSQRGAAPFAAKRKTGRPEADVLNHGLGSRRRRRPLRDGLRFGENVGLAQDLQDAAFDFSLVAGRLIRDHLEGDVVCLAILRIIRRAAPTVVVGGKILEDFEADEGLATLAGNLRSMCRILAFRRARPALSAKLTCRRNSRRRARS